MRPMDPLDSPVSGVLAWSMAALHCAKRLLAGGQKGIEQHPDALLLMLSLRNLVRAAEWRVKTVKGTPEEATRRQAVADFLRRLPNLVDARDVLEHFDEYGSGRGRIQQRAASKGEVPAVYRFAVATEGVDVVIRVGPYRFNVALLQDACRELTISLLALEEEPDRGQVEPSPYPG
ncbi:hypothetical protein [Micromonospora chalcea]|uniref:hypothetical protein n=1 Tax=Micromonospora chalcea TaxID=1874 RepID=UPI0038127740